jgi:two-component system sensor histidine kinase BaeS
VGFFSILALAADAFGFLEFPARNTGWIIPAGLVFLLGLVMAVRWGTRGLRRISAPLDELLEASNRVAEGDYSVRVEERGPQETRSLGQAFNSMVSRLQVNDQQRRAMLADLTHELRTPLTVMRGNLEGMLDGLYPVQEERLKAILEETQTLSRLVDDLRTQALAESGALQLRLEPVDLAGLVRECAAAFEAQADSVGVSLEIRLEAAPVVEVDPQRMREILSNLMSNALRYSPRGGAVQVQLTEAVTGGERSARISVVDQGPGIAVEDLPHIFDRFHKSSDSGGMGLGLSIAKSLVEAHGGGILAESAPGQGTRISFTLPR